MSEYETRQFHAVTHTNKTVLTNSKPSHIELTEPDKKEIRMLVKTDKSKVTIFKI